MPLSIFRRNFSLQWRSFGRLCVVLQYDIDCRPLDIVLGWRAVHNLDIGDSGRGHCFESLDHLSLRQGGRFTID